MQTKRNRVLRAEFAALNWDALPAGILQQRSTRDELSANRKRPQQRPSTRIISGLSIARNLYRSHTFIRGSSKSCLSPTYALDYSYRKATIGSTRIARRVGM
jgi:hypothetical protein